MDVAEYARMYEAEDRQWWYVGMRAIALGLLRPALPAGRLRLLDAGCGTGRNVQDLSALGRAVGLDIAPEAMALCRARGVGAVRGSVLNLPFASGSFDVVTSFDVLYHRWVADDRAAVRELGRVLRPQGLLLLRLPALRLLWGAHDAAVHSRHRYTLSEVRTLLEDGGFTVLRASYANSFLFPLLLVHRTLDRLLRRSGSDVGFLPAPVESAFLALLHLEARLIPHLTLPVGASIVALARR
jgi:SAM-dependent methyltransferase